MRLQGFASSLLSVRRECVDGGMVKKGKAATLCRKGDLDPGTCVYRPYRRTPAAGRSRLGRGREESSFPFLFSWFRAVTKEGIECGELQR